MRGILGGRVEITSVGDRRNQLPRWGTPWVSA